MLPTVNKWTVSHTELSDLHKVPHLFKDVETRGSYILGKGSKEYMVGQAD